MIVAKSRNRSPGDVPAQPCADVALGLLLETDRDVNAISCPVRMRIFLFALFAIIDAALTLDEPLGA